MTARSLIAFLNQLSTFLISACSLAGQILNFASGSIWVQFVFIMTDLFASFHCPTLEYDIFCAHELVLPPLLARYPLECAVGYYLIIRNFGA